MPGEAPFADRFDAGHKLARRLRHLADRDALVLALPRGGVPVGYAIAQALHAQLDLLFVRKLGAPGHEELGIGAIVDGADPHIILNEEVMADITVTPQFLATQISKELGEIDRRRLAYRGEQPSASMAGRIVIIVDDGVATGGTALAALEAARKNHPAHLALAVPVAAADVVARLRPHCDELICLVTPSRLGAVGYFYDDFTQTSDAEVVALLARAPRARWGVEQ